MYQTSSFVIKEVNLNGLMHNVDSLWFLFFNYSGQHFWNIQYFYGTVKFPRFVNRKVNVVLKLPFQNIVGALQLLIWQLSSEKYWHLIWDWPIKLIDESFCRIFGPFGLAWNDLYVVLLGFRICKIYTNIRFNIKIIKKMCIYIYVWNLLGIHICSSLHVFHVCFIFYYGKLYNYIHFAYPKKSVRYFYVCMYACMIRCSATRKLWYGLLCSVDVRPSFITSMFKDWLLVCKKFLLSFTFLFWVI